MWYSRGTSLGELVHVWRSASWNCEGVEAAVAGATVEIAVGHRRRGLDRAARGVAPKLCPARRVHRVAAAVVAPQPRVHRASSKIAGASLLARTVSHVLVPRRQRQSDAACVAIRTRRHAQEVPPIVSPLPRAHSAG